MKLLRGVLGLRAQGLGPRIRGSGQIKVIRGVLAMLLAVVGRFAG